MPQIDYLNQSAYTTHPFMDADIATTPSHFPYHLFSDIQLEIGPTGTWTYDDQDDITRAFRLITLTIIFFGGNYNLIGVFLGSVNDGATPIAFVLSLSDIVSGGNYQTVFLEGNSTYLETGSLALTMGIVDPLDLSAIPGPFPYTYSGINLRIKKENIINNTNLYVPGINVLNHWSTQYSDPNCSGEDPVDPSSEDENYHKENSEPLTGNLVFAPGRYVDIQTNIIENSLRFTATTNSVVSGELPCSDSYSTPRTDPPGYTLNGASAPECQDLIFSVNGINVEKDSNIFTVEGGSGLTVYSPNNNEVEVLINPKTITGGSDSYELPSCADEEG